MAVSVPAAAAPQSFDRGVPSTPLSRRLRSRLGRLGRDLLIAEISAGLGSLKAAKDILQAMNGMQSAAAVNDVKLTLQGHLLDAHQGLFAAQEVQTAASRRIADLEQEIVRLKDWTAEKQRYQLHDVGRGAMTYVPKPGMENGEPPHWLCAKCFNQGQKSFMQNRGNGVGNRNAADRGQDKTYACDTCRASIQVYWNVSPETDRAKVSV